VRVSTRIASVGAVLAGAALLGVPSAAAQYGPPPAPRPPVVAAPARVPSAPAACSFALGFKALHDLIPDVVGDCRVDEHHSPVNGDGLQETAGVDGKGGLLVWRKADNWTAYTDGYRTWINGPSGLQSRLNTESFPWEAPAPEPASTPATTSRAPAPAPAGQDGGTSGGSGY
jgi:hypothetical protein